MGFDREDFGSLSRDQIAEITRAQSACWDELGAKPSMDWWPAIWLEKVEHVYPQANAAPTGRTMSACEVLCWIAYRRAVPKGLYFAPLTLLNRLGTFPHERLFHASIPPSDFGVQSMDEAERLLMEGWRADCVRPMDNETNLAVPGRVGSYAVAISARGFLETDNGATAADQERADKLPRYGVHFLTSEVLLRWPPCAIGDRARSRGGRPKKYDWERKWPAILNYLEDNGSPHEHGDAAKLVEFILQQFPPDAAPSETQTKEKAKEFVRRFEERRKVGN
ncbi:hypothetical protein [Acidisoma sp. S159]|uniref:hypothetical protein n=1 Tax=Acidisoma sp. S159 TaxID=1747225 RepID=UPI00131D1954|nr:hypothetical protein [Acidisoma sp. S159]